MGKTTDEMTRGDRDDIDDMNAEEFSATEELPGTEEEVAVEIEVAQIRDGIRQTRAGMAATIDALQEKLDPERIAEQVKDQVREKAAELYDSAKETVREATIGRAEKMVSNFSDSVSDATERAGTAVRETGSSVVQYIRDHPLPCTLIGLGLGMLAVNARRTGTRQYGSRERFRGIPYYQPEANLYGADERSFSDRGRDTGSGIADSAREAVGNLTDRAKDAVTSAASSVRDTASNVADATREQVSELSDQARYGARVAGNWLMNTLDDNPLALGVAALATGAIIGLALPETRVEREYMGEARDQFVDRAKSVARETAEKVQRVTEEAGRTLKQAAQKEGLTTGGSGEPSQSSS